MSEPCWLLSVFSVSQQWAVVSFDCLSLQVHVSLGLDGLASIEWPTGLLCWFTLSSRELVLHVLKDVGIVGIGSCCSQGNSCCSLALWIPRLQSLCAHP